MKVKTKIFGEIEIDEEKVICFENGIVGFPELKRGKGSCLHCLSC